MRNLRPGGFDKLNHPAFGFFDVVKNSSIQYPVLTFCSGGLSPSSSRMDLASDEL
ncbi:MAG: hypothetical protein R2879_13680 [Saprospiraceae bacterium]